MAQMQDLANEFLTRAMPWIRGNEALIFVTGCILLVIWRMRRRQRRIERHLVALRQVVEALQDHRERDLLARARHPSTVVPFGDQAASRAASGVVTSAATS